MLPPVLTLDDVPLEHTTLTVPGAGLSGTLDLHVVQAGPADGAPVLLLHGFPDFWYGWRHQIPALARAGYRVIVPDQRGYGASGKPRGVAPYAARHLAADLVALQDALAVGPTHVVGHDWGGGVAWQLAGTRPDRVRSLVVINCPRPLVLRRALFTNLRQLRRSWYILFFQLPVVPALWLRGRGASGALKATSAPGAFTREDLDRHAEVATFEAMRAATAWYKASLLHPPSPAPPEVPTLLLWGTQDAALGNELAEPSLADVPDHRLVWIDGASHWVPHERPDVVNTETLDHLSSFGGPDPLVHKIVDREAWAHASDPWPGAEVDLRDGYIHLSAGHQVEGTLLRHFAGRRDLLVLGIDPGHLPPGTLRWEVSRGGERFPHLHGPLPRSAVVRLREVPSNTP
jgi:pimeloyl-ACP methyl ester carboxylesterase/uncharacterized protein (DUF952 family)